MAEQKKKMKRCPVSMQPDIENLLNDLSPEDFSKASKEEKDDFIQDRKSVSYWKDAWRRLKKNVVAMVALGVIVLLFLFAFLGPVLVPYGYDEFNKGAENLYPYHYTLEDQQKLDAEIASRTKKDVVDVDEMIAKAKEEAEAKGEEFTKKDEAVIRAQAKVAAKKGSSSGSDSEEEIDQDALRKELGIKKVVSLSKDQEQALIQCIYMNLNRKTAGILIALFTGVRIGELCGLQMKDISLADKTISINKTVQRIYDKKKGESYVHIGPPKTKTSARTIPVPSLLMNIIKKFYTDNPNHYFLTGKIKPTEPRTYRQFFTRFLKRNGLEKVKFHEIRHTFAVRAIEIPEFDIKSLSEILGHKNVSFTLNVYGSANLQQKVKCMNLLNDLL